MRKRSKPRSLERALSAYPSGAPKRHSERFFSALPKFFQVWDSSKVNSELDSRRATFATLIDIWNGDLTKDLLNLLTDDYQGEMLHLEKGARGKKDYPAWISSYLTNCPGVTFTVVEQYEIEGGLLSRVFARKRDGTFAHGFNRSLFVGNLIAKETAVWSAWFPAIGEELSADPQKIS
jgi:hypothetical protein